MLRGPCTAGGVWRACRRRAGHLPGGGRGPAAQRAAAARVGAVREAAGPAAGSSCSQNSSPIAALLGSATRARCCFSGVVPCAVPMGHFGDCLQDASDLFARAAAVDPQDERTWLAAALLERRRGNYLQVSAWNWRAIARPIAVSGLRARWYWRCQTSHMFAQCICHFSGRLHCMSHASNVQPSTSSQGGLRVCKRFCEVDMLQH